MPELPLDRIHIRDLRARCIIGVNADERDHKQDVILNLTIHTDLSRPAESDDIRDTVDYKALKNEVLDFVETSTFKLIERLAGGVADLVLGFDSVQGVDVTVDKPGALSFARSVAVELSRRRGE